MIAVPNLDYVAGHMMTLNGLMMTKMMSDAEVPGFSRASVQVVVVERRAEVVAVTLRVIVDEDSSPLFQLAVSMRVG